MIYFTRYQSIFYDADYNLFNSRTLKIINI